MPDFHRTNINLYIDDVAYLRQRYGYGWTEYVRDIVHQHVREECRPPYKPKGPTTSISYAEWRKINQS